MGGGAKPSGGHSARNNKIHPSQIPEGGWRKRGGGYLKTKSRKMAKERAGENPRAQPRGTRGGRLGRIKPRAKTTKGPGGSEEGRKLKGNNVTTRRGKARRKPFFHSPLFLFSCYLTQIVPFFVWARRTKKITEYQ